MKAFRIADNKVAESDWDLDALAAELAQLKEIDYDLELTGFDDEDISHLLGELDVSTPYEEQEYELSNLEEPTVIVKFVIRAPTELEQELYEALQKIIAQYDGVDMEVKK